MVTTQKPVQPSSSVAHNLAILNSYRLFILDKTNNLRFLTDTGADILVLSHSVRSNFPLKS